MKGNFITMETTKKITKKTYLATLTALVNDAENNGVELPEDVTYDGLREFVDHEVELLDKKAEAAAKRQAEKKIEGDALREKIASVLTDEFQTINEIVNAIGDPSVTAAMVTPRLSQLAKLDPPAAVKDQKSVAGVDGGKSRKVSVYRKA